MSLMIAQSPILGFDVILTVNVAKYLRFLYLITEKWFFSLATIFSSMNDYEMHWTFPRRLFKQMGGYLVCCQRTQCPTLRRDGPLYNPFVVPSRILFSPFFGEEPGHEKNATSKKRVKNMQTQKTYNFSKQRQADISTDPHRMPAKSFRSGAMNVAIWENEVVGNNGEPAVFKTVTFERRYKDKQTGEWKTSTGLRINDLPKASLLLSKAYEYLVLTGADEEEY